MKKQVLQITIILVTVIAFFTGCDKSDKVIVSPSDGLVQFVAKASAGDPETRIGYSESGNRMNYTWGELNTEKFSVFVPGSNAKHDFLLKGGAHSNNGRFEGTLPSETSTTYAIYPALSADPASLSAMTHNLSNQGLYTTAESLFGNPHHLMWSTANVNNGEVDYQFVHKVSMLKLELTFTGVTSKIKSVSILGGHYKANLNATNGVLSYEEAGKGVITASDATGFTLVDNVLTAYVYLFPEDLTSSTLTITAVDETGKAYTSGDFNGRVLTAGAVYRLRKNMSESDYIVTGNSKWAIGNLIADGANGAKLGAPEDGGLYFQYGSLVGWSGCGNVDGTSRGAGNPLSLQVKPVTCSISTWNSSWTGDPTSDVPETGTGDPCRYYLGAPWRLPSQEDLNALFGQEETSSDHLTWGDDTDAVGWSKEGGFSVNSTTSYASHTSGLKFPVSGLRYSLNGSLTVVGQNGTIWSVSPFDENNGLLLYFDFVELYPIIQLPRTYGLPVRCVRD